MPELPEVETTVRGLKKYIVRKKILDVWTDLSTKDKRQAGNIANPKFFPKFRRAVRNAKIVSVERRAKNILINLNNGKTILIHMKMTGHLLYGRYEVRDGKWVPKKEGPLGDPFNRFIHVVFSLSGKKHLAFSDARKFGKVTLMDTETAHDTKHLNGIGPEPLDKNFTLVKFKERLSKKLNGKVKSVLMDQSVIAGIGNIYSDEILWRAGVHPLRKVSKIKEGELKSILKATKETLSKGIDLGGDSMSDYRDLLGRRGKFQLHHMAYQRTDEKCQRKNCRGVVKKIALAGRSTHFCPVHQR
ncbi:MAG: DNA-formamidopyrimidine glycosylase [Patescibacteria group bacterium]